MKISARYIEVGDKFVVIWRGSRFIGPMIVEVKEFGDEVEFKYSNGKVGRFPSSSKHEIADRDEK